MLAEVLQTSEHNFATEASTCLRIGGVGVGLLSDLPIQISPQTEQFQVFDCRWDLKINVIWVDAIRPVTSDHVFDSGAVWTLDRDGGDFIFDFASPRVGPGAYKRLRTADFLSAEIMMNGALLPRDASPFEYPLDELLITNHLAVRGLGVEVHGCGLIDAERGGFLFFGHSGAGKSTTAGLWNSIRQPEILSDDRLILRLHEGELWMYGTPWHGEAAFASPGKVKLKQIFVLQHGDRNRTREMRRAEAAGELFARSFPPFHSAEGLERTIEFLNRVVETVPCYEFHFVPDESAVRAALEFHG